MNTKPTVLRARIAMLARERFPRGITRSEIAYQFNMATKEARVRLGTIIMLMVEDGLLVPASESCANRTQPLATYLASASLRGGSLTPQSEGAKQRVSRLQKGAVAQAPPG